MDLKEARIVMQNALAHATQITLHNARLTNKEVTEKEVIEMAKRIAVHVMSIGTGDNK